MILTFTIVNYSFEVSGLFWKKNEFQWLQPYDSPSVIEPVYVRDIYSNSLYLICLYTKQTSGLGSAVGIATAYGLDGRGIESRWGEIFRTSPDWPWGPPSLLYNGYRVFPGDNVLPGRDADPSPPSSAEV